MEVAVCLVTLMLYIAFQNLLYVFHVGLAVQVSLQANFFEQSKVDRLSGARKGKEIEK